jgi:hypothetical protein
LAVVDLPQLAENDAPLVPPHGKDGGRVFDEQDRIAGGGVGVATLRCRAKLLQQSRVFVAVESAEEGVLGDIANCLHLRQPTSAHDGHGCLASAGWCNHKQPRRGTDPQVVGFDGAHCDAEGSEIGLVEPSHQDLTQRAEWVFGQSNRRNNLTRSFFQRYCHRVEPAG